MSGVCEHGKPVATQADLDAYAERSRCMERGDCDCHICDQLCWESACMVKLLASAARPPGGGEGEKSDEG